LKKSILVCTIKLENDARQDGVRVAEAFTMRIKEIDVKMKKGQSVKIQLKDDNFSKDNFPRVIQQYIIR